MHPTIVIVSNSSDTVSLFVQVAGKIDTVCLSPTSKKEALAMACSDQCALVLLDMEMDSMNWQDILSDIRANQSSQFLPVVFLTSSLTKGQELTQKHNDEIIDFLLKPLIPMVVTARLKVFIQLFKQQMKINDLRQKNQLLLSKEEKMVDEIHQFSRFDHLTGLANRKVFLEFLTREIERSKRHELNIAVLFVDLDNFKDINDTQGHNIGDQLLVSVAKRLQICVRGEDMVARLGGDDFAIVLVELHRHENSAVVAQKIISSLEQPHIVSGFKVVISASIGIAVFPGSGQSADEINKAADVAMYHAKRYGKNNYQFFAQDMQNQAIERMRLEQDLRSSISNNELMVYYQPKISAANNDIVGLEALLRWNHPDHGMVSPGRFIPVAEECGLIVGLGEWVMNAACDQNAKWARGYPDSFQATIAINVSLYQLKQKQFQEMITRVMADTGISAARLEVEITESTIMDSPDEIIPILEMLHDKGIKIAVDDFGTGYSSLSYLRRLPLDCLKIDISFVRNIGVSKEDETIIKTIIDLGHNLDMEVVAEGVETEEQAEFLRQHNCDILQGFLFNKPLPAEQIVPLIQL